jgi:hypothetical protein
MWVLDFFFRLKGLLPRFHFSRKKPPVRYNRVLKTKKVRRKVNNCCKQKQVLQTAKLFKHYTIKTTTTGASQTAASIKLSSGDHMDDISFLRVCFEKLQGGSAAVPQ